MTSLSKRRTGVRKPSNSPAPTTNRWTIVPRDGSKYCDISWNGHDLWHEASDVLPEWLAYEAWDSLVAAVRRAEVTPDLAALLPTWQAVREWLGENRFSRRMPAGGGWTWGLSDVLEAVAALVREDRS